MRQKAAFFVLLWTLIGVIPIFAQDKGEIIQETKPYYNWAGGIELGYFTPVDYYKELINPGYYLKLIQKKVLKLVRTEDTPFFSVVLFFGSFKTARDSNETVKNFSGLNSFLKAFLTPKSICF